MNHSEGCSCPHIHGVKCEVTNCVYNDKKEYCTANEIKVGPSYASAPQIPSVPPLSPNKQGRNKQRKTEGGSPLFLLLPLFEVVPNEVVGIAKQDFLCQLLAQAVSQ